MRKIDARRHWNQKIMKRERERKMVCVEPKKKSNIESASFSSTSRRDI